MHASRCGARHPLCWLRRVGPGLVMLLGACVENPDSSAPPSLDVAASVVPYEGFEQGFYLPFNDLVLVDQAGVQVVANGNVALSFADSSFRGTVDANDQLDDFEADIGMNGAVTLEISVEGAGDLASDHDLFTLSLPSFTIGPVEVFPYAKGRLLLSGTADAAARMSMVAPFRVGSFFSNGGTQADPTSAPRFDPEIGKPELSGDFLGTVELEVDMVFLTNIMGFPVGGPVVGPRLGVTLDADTMTWSLDGDVQVVWGWALPDAAGLPVVPEDLDELTNLPPWNIAGGQVPNLGPSTRWARVFDVENDDNAGAAALFGNRVVVVESGDEPWLASLQDGVPSWQSEATSGWIPKSIVRAKNGDILVAGVNSNNNDIRVERYSAAGTPRWTNTMTVPGAVLQLCPPQSVRCDGILPTSSNGAIVSGRVTYPQQEPRLIFAAIDRDGNITSSNELEMGAGTADPVVHALAQTAAGEILAVGAIDYSDGAGATIGGENALVLRLDASAAPLTAHAVGGLHEEQAHQLAVFPDGTFAIAGDAGSAAPFGVWIASLDQSDALLWSGSYESRSEDPNNIDISTVTGVSALPDRGLLVSGNFGSPDRNGWILRVNQAGMPVWVKTYISADEDGIAEVLALPDGLIALGETGFTESNGSYTDLWLLRTSVDGMLHFIDGNGFDAENTDAQWQRFSTSDHTVHTLAPAQVASMTMTGAPAALTASATGAVGELITD